ESAEWLRKDDNKASFLSNFGAEFAFLETLYRALAEFAPVSLNINLPSSIACVERSSSLPTGAIRKISWVKRPDLRKKDQKVAHAIIAFSTAQTANHAIRNGVNIEGKKVTVHRMQPEPTRCYKCQVIGNHFAKNCPSNEEICGTCSEHSHTTKDCTTTDHMERFCVNCKQAGHASWDRECKSFIAARDRLSARNKEANLKYFPVLDDPSSW
ncbi:hypothetical protein EV363DRAFT_1100254, partial [Boletus edulis]